MTDGLPLAGARVLDLTRETPGHACAHIFEQLGAQVHSAEPGAVSGSELPDCDLVVSDLRRSELDEIGWTRTHDGPSIVSITPFGLDGPYADCNDVRLASHWLGPRASAALTAAHAAVAGLAALRLARRRGQPFLAEVATYEVAATCLGDALPPLVCRLPPRPDYGRSRTIVAPCADGFVGLAAPTGVDSAQLAALTGVPAVATEGADVGALLADWLSARTRLQIFHEAQLWRIPVVPVLTHEEVLGDEQSFARGFWEPSRTGKPQPGTPFRVVGASVHQPLAASRLTPALPLSDVRVLDLGMVWAGPYSGRLLAGLGAEVIKVEGPARRDGTRPPDDWEGCAGVFSDLNRGKGSLVVDLADQAGRAAFLRVAADVDVVLDSFSPRVMPNLGLSHTVLHQVNPGIITLSMPAFGSDGPWGSYVAYGSGLELVSGLAGCGPGGCPQPASVPYLDYLSGAYGAIAVLAALIARDTLSSESRSRGVHVEVAQREVACHLLADGLQCLRDDGSPFDPASLARDPHLIARLLFAPADASQCEHYARLPWLLHGVRPAVERSAPPFGNDSRQVLRRAGISQREIDDLIRNGVVVARDDPGVRAGAVAADDPGAWGRSPQ